MRSKHSGSFLSRIDFFLLDLFSIEVSFVIAYMLKFGLRLPFAAAGWRNIGIILGLVDALVLVVGQFLTDIRRRGYMREALSLIVQTAVVMLLITGFMYLQKTGAAFSRAVLIMTAGLHLVISYVLRAVWKAILMKLMGKHTVRYLLIGSNDKAAEFAHYLQKDRILHARVTVHLGENPLPGVDGFSGSPELLEQYLKENTVDVVVCADDGLIPHVAGLCEKYGVRVGAIPSFSREMSSAATVEEYGSVKLLNFRETPLDNRTNDLLKRVCDILMSCILIVLTSPIMLALAIGVKVTSPGPILFRQTRVGRNRKEFQMLKFRSMRVTSTENTGWSTNEDNRKTKFGSFIRKFSLDELPQFFNVLKG